MIDRIPPPIRILAAAAWTLLLVVLMLSPGRGSFAVDLSNAFGGTELTDAIGHALLAFVEVLLVFGALRAYASERHTLVIAAVITLLLGAVLEAAQLWVPYRGSNLLDFGAHTLGTLAGTLMLWVRRRYRVGQDSP